MDIISNNEISKLTSEQEDILEKNLVWIFGSARSGTTWLADKLLSYNTKMINEPHITEFFDFQASHRFPKVGRMYDEYKEFPFYFFSDKYRDSWNYFMRKFILNRFNVEIKDLSKKIIIKEPGGLGASDIITEILPNCKIIIMIRDPRDIIDSIWDAVQEGGFMSKLTAVSPKKNKDRIKFIENQANIWVKLMESLLETYERQPKGRVIQVKYEELRTGTFENLKRIYQYLEIDIKDEKVKQIFSKHSFENIPSSQKGTGKFTRSATPGKWKEHFSEKEKNIVNGIISNTLEKIGYEI